jgi:DNA segregation ATPase FtsK/SpoIIIE, S-DNA-T family
MPVWRLQVRDPRGTDCDLFLDADEHTPTERVVEELDALGFHARPFGIHGHSLATAETIAETGLGHGDVITVGSLEPHGGWPGPGRYVVAVCGPDAGRWWPLPPAATHTAATRSAAPHSASAVTVGRSGRGLVVDDPLLSAQHFSVRSHDAALELADLGSTNGTAVENNVLDGATSLQPGTYFQAGSTVFTVVELTDDDLAVLGPTEGPTTVLPRQYRRALSTLPERLDAPKEATDDNDSMAGTWWRALIPLISGLGFAAVTGRWIFLLIMAAAPLILAVDAYRRRRGANAKSAKKRAEMEAAQAEFEQRLGALRSEERDRRRDSAALGGLSVLAVAARRNTLWQRRPDDADFLHVGIGLATLPSGVAASREDSADRQMWGMPVETGLVDTGSLAIVGEPQRGRAVARSVLLSIAAHHSPSDVQISVLCNDPTGEQWGFSRWLPHMFEGERGCRIGADPDGRAALLTSIDQLLESRRDIAARRTAQPPNTLWPMHVVVVDDTSLVTPAVLTELLTDGPALGIVGLTIDSRLAPEGAGATLTIAPTADTSTFHSRHQPRLDGVAIAQVSPTIADTVARRLAGLRPSTGDDNAMPHDVVHLVDLLDRAHGQALDGAEVAQRWASISPRTDVVVGMAGETSMHVDLVDDGPHGLVGGTSGSGKTEFLKTLFCSLALNNHPDDLSIVVVDFKGGVDHEAIAPLPHVVDIATNLDVEQFRRTLTLLGAESRRRQELLATAGASNIDSYRLARAANPRLPQLPRLLVVVDEFGELLASDNGRAQLKELESMTRIGRALGLHLLLVTQNFDGALPPQIDANAGMRICLRVQKPAHSKAVLDSGIAATIPDRAVGRAYASFRGRGLVEFQTARVAGRRRDLAVLQHPIRAHLTTFTALALPAPHARPEDVPFEDTDMHVMIAAIRNAATSSGWTKSAVPWPSSLPTHVSLAALGRRSDGCGTAPVGLADVPDEQRRELVGIGEHDEQVALLGGPSAPLHDVLATYATSIASTTSADDAHIYAVDLLGRGLAALADLPHCGAVAVRNDALALRIIRWMTQLAAERRVDIARSGSATVWEHAKSTGDLPPRVVLLVAGADRLLSTDGSSSNLLAPLTMLMAESIGTRIQIVLSGLPKIVTHRLGMNVERRFVFQLADSAELSAVGVPRGLTTELRIERRAYEPAAGRLVQFARLGEPGRPEGALIRSIAGALAPATCRRPKSFADVSWPLAWEQSGVERLAPPAHAIAPIPIGVSIDDGEWLWADADDDGPVFAVTGPPKSGRSTALAVIARTAAMYGIPSLNVVLSRRSPLSHTDAPELATRVEPAHLGDALGATSGRVLVIIDDLQRVTDGALFDAIAPHRHRVLTVVAGSPDLLSSRVGVLRSLPVASAGLLLAPTGSLDGAAIGLRRLPPEWTSNPRPGRGILALAGEATEIQIPLPERSGRESHRIPADIAPRTD